MTRAAYRKFLEDSGIDYRGLTRFPHHLPASAHGGHGYTRITFCSRSGRRSIGRSVTILTLNCFLAGKEKCVKAVEIALRVAADEGLWEHVEKRGRRRVFLHPGRPPP